MPPSPTEPAAEPAAGPADGAATGAVTGPATELTGPPAGAGAPVPPAPAGPAGLVSVCPGCGAVLAAAPDLEVRHPGASPACTRLFDVTVRGLRDEAPSDQRAATVLGLATAAYDAQHPVADGHPVADDTAVLGPLLDQLGVPAGAAVRPARWTTTVADVAADLDVVDLPALVRSWAQAVAADWTGTGTRR